MFTKRKFLNLAYYFPFDVKLRLLANSRSFLANQKARNAIVGDENLLTRVIRTSQSSQRLSSREPVYRLLHSCIIHCLKSSVNQGTTLIAFSQSSVLKWNHHSKKGCQKNVV